MGIITIGYILCIVFGHRADIYPWLDKEMVAHDEVLKGKTGFLKSYVYFLVFQLLYIGLWSYLGKKLRDLSLESDERDQWIMKLQNMVKQKHSVSAYYIVFYVLLLVLLCHGFG